MTRNAWIFALSMFLAGTIGVFVVESGVSTFNVVFLRCLIAAPLLGLYAAFTGQLNPGMFRTKEFKFILLGCAALVFNWYFLFKSFELTSITLGIISYNTAPFFLILLGTLFLGERVTLRALNLTLLAFGGLVAITLGGEGVSLGDRGFLLGIGAGLLAALLYAALTFLGKKVVDTPPVFVSFIQNSGGRSFAPSLHASRYVWQRDELGFRSPVRRSSYSVFIHSVLSGDARNVHQAVSGVEVRRARCGDGNRRSILRRNAHLSSDHRRRGDLARGLWGEPPG